MGEMAVIFKERETRFFTLMLILTGDMRVYCAYKKRIDFSFLVRFTENQRLLELVLKSRGQENMLIIYYEVEKKAIIFKERC